MEEKYRALLADNLTKFRKAANLTQYELAEKLNYSDKAISKWERGEAFPDIFVLRQIAELYGISLDDLFKPNIQFRIRTAKDILRTRGFITVISFISVWFVATLVFFILVLTANNFAKKWMSFIYAIPVSFIFITVFSAVWKKRLYCFISSTITLWSIALSIYLSIPTNIVSNVFILCIPIQVILTTIFAYLILINKQKRVEIKLKQNK